MAPDSGAPAWLAAVLVGLLSAGGARWCHRFEDAIVPVDNGRAEPRPRQRRQARRRRVMPLRLGQRLVRQLGGLNAFLALSHHVAVRKRRTRT